MIEIFINGERKTVDEHKALAVVLEENDFNCARVAVAVNSEFVARGNYKNYFLKANDKLDVVAPVAGG